MNITDVCFYKDKKPMDYSRPDWMGELDDAKFLSELSVPGTHDTMSRYGGWPVYCQSLTLGLQLQAGIRAFDIRLRHVNDLFAIHHGPTFQHAWFEDVMGVFIGFLAVHPSETIIMRAQKTHTEQNVTRTFGETFEYYMSRAKDGGKKYRDWVWKGEPDTGFDKPPRLQDVRGKIVILQDFEAVESQGHDMTFGIPWSSLTIQDNYKVWWTHASMNRKWADIRTQIKAAMTDNNSQSWYVNFTSGSTHMNPVDVARGTRIWKFCDGMNVRTYEYITKCYDSSHKLPKDPKVLKNADYCAPCLLDKNQQGRLGIIMMDYPGLYLIDAIIAHNKGLERRYEPF